MRALSEYLPIMNSGGEVQRIYAHTLDHVNRKMRSLNSYITTHSSLDQTKIYTDINCNFVICQRCFWSATVFNLIRKQNKNNNGYDRTIDNCPLCSNKNISIISILIHEKESRMLNVV